MLKLIFFFLRGRKKAKQKTKQNTKINLPELTLEIALYSKDLHHNKVY